MSAQPDLAAELATDRFVESYVLWREACEDVHTAYSRWQTCEPPHLGLAFERYLAALDHEERTARTYADWTDRVRACEP